MKNKPVLQATAVYAILFIAVAIVLVIICTSCSHVTTPERAAKYGARCGTHL